MKKTTLTILFASVMMLALIGCGTKKAEAASDPWEETTVAEETPETTEETPAKTEEPQTEAAQTEAVDTETAEETAVSLSDDSFAYNGKIISIKDDLQNILDGLGAGNSSNTDQAGELCYDIGTDAINVFTKDNDGNEVLTQITIHDKTVRTAKGVGVGSTEAEVKTAYGEPDSEIVEGAKLWNYDFDGYSILFAFNDNVAAISYFIAK